MTSLAATSGDAGESVHLAFRLGAERYAVEVLRVREIIGLGDVTPLPRTPEHVRGVINLRGRIVPVIHLGLRLGLGASEPTRESCVVVVEAAESADSERFPVGLIVDAVEEVIEIPPASIEPAPRQGGLRSSPCVRGLASVGERVLVLLDIDRVTSADDGGRAVETPGGGPPGGSATAA